MIRVRWSEGQSSTETKKTGWLPVLENELRRRMGWVDEAISPFARKRRQAEAKPPKHLPRADTLLFPRGERQSA